MNDRKEKALQALDNIESALRAAEVAIPYHSGKIASMARDCVERAIAKELEILKKALQ